MNSKKTLCGLMFVGLAALSVGAKADEALQICGGKYYPEKKKIIMSRCPNGNTLKRLSQMTGLKDLNIMGIVNLRPSS